VQPALRIAIISTPSSLQLSDPTPRAVLNDNVPRPITERAGVDERPPP
jgi:hypothetical protein